MPDSLNSGIRQDANLMNLQAIKLEEIRPEVNDLLLDGEKYVAAFKTIRDQVVFTDKRLIAINVQGITGKKVAYMSYPYSKVESFAVETAGMLDIDSELTLKMIGGAAIQLDFKANVDMKMLSHLIASYVL